MPLDDREYMREVPIYRDLTGRADATGGGSQPPRRRLTGRDHFASEPGRRRQTPVARPARRTRPWAWALIGVAGALAVAVHFGPWLRSDAPAPNLAPNFASPIPTIVVSPKPPVATPTHGRTGRRVGLIRGVRILQFGGRLTLSGRSAPRGGDVRVLGRWNADHWQVFAVANADGRRYRFVFPLNHRGTLRLRVVNPDGYTSVATYHVVS